MAGCQSPPLPQAALAAMLGCVLGGFQNAGTSTDRPPEPQRQRRRRSPRPARRHADRRRGGGHRRAHPCRPQDGDPADRQGRADPQIRPDHRLRHQRHRAPASTSTCTTAPWATSPATMRWARACATSRWCRRPSARASRAIVRDNGKVGTRNYIGVLSTVNCSASRSASSSPSASRTRSWRDTRTSTASSPSPTAPAAAWPTAARATPPCSGRCGASPSTPISPRS